MSDHHDTESGSAWEVDDIKLAAAGAVVALGLVVVALVGMFTSNGDTRRGSYQADAGSSELRPVHVRRSGEGERAGDYHQRNGGGGGGQGGAGGGQFSAFQNYRDDDSTPCVAKDFDQSVKDYGGLRMFAYFGAKSADPCAN